MRNDQVVRAIAVGGMVALYAVYLGLNGAGQIDSGVAGVGTIHPFFLTTVVILTLALPEFVEMMPRLPSRGK